MSELKINHQSMDRLEKAIDRLIKHLPGQHNQMSHAHGGSSAPDTGGSYGTSGGESKLASFEKKIVDRKNEEGACFGSDGNITHRYSGTRGKIEIPMYQVTDGILKGTIFTHNHPNQTPPSPDDAQLMVQAGMKELRAVTKKYTYSVKPKRGTTRIDGRSLARDLKNAEAGFYEKEKKRLEQKVREYTMLKSDMKKKLSAFEIETSIHKAWTLVAPKYGLSYRRAKT